MDSTVTERIIRQTDGGSDNVAWVTHGMHYMLVHEGAFQQIDWVLLEPGHSHCTQDLFDDPQHLLSSPRHWPWLCITPGVLGAMIVDALKEMNGGMEMLWQLANFDFGKRLNGCIAGSFSHYG
eukprot:6212759-Pleurochrysis_carterae.AAC.8